MKYVFFLTHSQVQTLFQVDFRAKIQNLQRTMKKRVANQVNIQLLNLSELPNNIFQENHILITGYEAVR